MYVQNTNYRRVIGECREGLPSGRFLKELMHICQVLCDFHLQYSRAVWTSCLDGTCRARHETTHDTRMTKYWSMSAQYYYLLRVSVGQLCRRQNTEYRSAYSVCVRFNSGRGGGSVSRDEGMVYIPWVETFVCI